MQSMVVTIATEKEFEEASAARIEKLKKRFAEALEKRNWCPCCGYCGVWPPSDGKEWNEFLTEVLSAANTDLG